VAEMALALALLVGAGLMVRSFLRLQMTNAGFNSQSLLTMRLLLSEDKYPLASEANNYVTKRTEFFEEVIKRIGPLPGVQSVSSVRTLHLNRGMPLNSFLMPVLFEGNPDVDIAKRPKVDVRMVNSNFFKTMGIPMLYGRDFTKREIIDPDARVIIINETMAR